MLTIFLLLFLISSPRLNLVYSAPPLSTSPTRDDWGEQIEAFYESRPANDVELEGNKFQQHLDSKGDPDSTNNKIFTPGAEQLDLIQELNSLKNASSLNKRQRNLVDFDGHTLTLRMPKGPADDSTFDIVFPFDTTCHEATFDISLLPLSDPTCRAANPGIALFPQSAANLPWCVSRKKVTFNDLRKRLEGYSEQELGKYAATLFRVVLTQARRVLDRVRVDDACKGDSPISKQKRESGASGPHSQRGIDTNLEKLRATVFKNFDKLSIFYVGNDAGFLLHSTSVPHANSNISRRDNYVGDDSSTGGISTIIGSFVLLTIVVFFTSFRFKEMSSNPLISGVYLLVASPLVNLLYVLIQKNWSVIHDLIDHQSPADDHVCIPVSHIEDVVRDRESITRADLQNLLKHATKGCTNAVFSGSSKVLPDTRSLLSFIGGSPPATDEVFPVTNEVFPVTNEVFPVTNEVSPVENEISSATDVTSAVVSS